MNTKIFALKTVILVRPLPLMNDPNFVGFLDEVDASLMLKSIVREYINRAQHYEFSLADKCFCVENSDMNEVKSKLEKDRNGHLDKILSSIGNLECQPAIGALLLKKTLHLSTEYGKLKEKPQLISSLFPYLLADYVDVISSVSKLGLDARMAVGFVLNVIVKNGFFNFIHCGDNARVKVLRNMRAHDNLVLDQHTWDANIGRLMTVFNDIYTLEEIHALEKDVISSKVVLLYDMNDKNVTAVIREEPMSFLKKLITLCHIQMFILNLSKIMVVSRNVFSDYWMKKYAHLLNGIHVKIMPVAEHQKILENSILNATMRGSKKLPPLN